MHPSSFLLLPLLSALALPSSVHAAASLLVDDAGTVADRQCQLETWYRPPRAGAELTAVAACAMHGTEWSIGVSRLQHAGALPWSLGVKRTLLGHDGTRAQLAVSAGWSADFRQRDAQAAEVRLPVSIALTPAGALQLHANVGWHHARSVRGLEHGVGTSLQISPRWSLLLEHARDTARERRTQGGLRRHLDAGASFDLLAGRNHHDRDDRWLTVGLNVPLSR